VGGNDEGDGAAQYPAKDGRYDFARHSPIEQQNRNLDEHCGEGVLRIDGEDDLPGGDCFQRVKIPGMLGEAPESERFERQLVQYKA
jgi:hypothetical protein